MSSEKHIWKTAAVLSAILLTGCEIAAPATDTETVLPQAFESAPAGAAADRGQLARFWTMWHDPVLSSLIEESLRGNYSLKAAEEKLEKARAQLGYRKSDQGASAGVGGQLGGGYGKAENSYIDNLRFPGVSIDDDGRALGVANVGALLSWEADIAGKKKSLTEAAERSLRAAGYERHTGEILVASSVADNYFRLLGKRSESKLIEKEIANYNELLRYTEGRFRAGQASAYEVLEVKNKIKSLEAELSTKKSDMLHHARAIAVLMGKAPEGFTDESIKGELPGKIPAVPAGVMPSDLLTMRPDLLARKSAIDARAAMVKAAKADLYPRFGISFLGSLGHIEIDSDIDHVNGGAGLLSLDLYVPVFTNGRTEANIKIKEAELRTELRDYDNTLISALYEVDDAYSQCSALERQGKKLKEGERNSTELTKSAEKLFGNDAVTFDRIIRAKDQTYSFRKAIIQNELGRHLSLIYLAKSLGGGWKAGSGK